MTENHDNVDSLVRTVGEFIDRHSLLSPGQGVLAAVSGGLDSVTLLAVLRALAAEPARHYRLAVAHLNHMLRPDAAQDERHVKELAGQWNLPCFTASVDVAAEAQRLGQGIEQAARGLRYDFLRRTAEEFGASSVATGHHADDNVETILYRAFRGTHIRGLGGMPLRRELAGDVTLVRPLLHCRREEIEAFCKRQGLSWREDATNLDVNYRRNFIRRELLPTLRKNLNPRVDEALLRLAAAAQEMDAFVAAQAAEAFKAALISAQAGGPVILDRAKLADRPRVLRAYAMRAAIEQAGVALRTIGAQRLAELADLLQSGQAAAVALPGGFTARREGDAIHVERTAEGDGPALSETALHAPGVTRLADGRTVACDVAPFDEIAFRDHCRHRPHGCEIMDADQLSGTLLCRPRRAGDTFCPLGSPGRQSVSNFLTNTKMPPTDRERILCICDDLGIVYVSPLRIDERLKVTPTTQRMLRVTVSPA